MRTRFRRSPEPDAFVVSGARASRHEDIARRQRKYLLAMTFRTLAFIGAVVLFLVGLQWEAAVLLASSLVAPIIGVVIANNHARSPEGQPELYRPSSDDDVPAITSSGPVIDG